MHRHQRFVCLFPALCLVAFGLISASAAQAQPNMADYLSRMDANGNGLLEPSEMSERFQGFWGATLRERGIDVSRPVPIDRISEVMQERFSRMRRDREESGGDRRSGRSSGDDGDRRSRYGRSRSRGGDDRRDDDRRSDNRRSSEPAAEAMLVPGFGNDFEPIPVPGFDTVVENDDDWESQYDRRTLETVRDMIRRYDRNNNGVLDRDEWADGRWRTDPASSDLDNDGRLTPKELAIRIAGFRNSNDRDGADRDDSRGGGDRGGERGGDRGRGGWGGRGGGGRFGSRDSSDPPAESRPSPTPSRNDKPAVTTYRFRTPTERLPKGMPEWFARKDVDGDGQVSMAEFASQWSQAEVAEFRSWDHNGDGLITADECLAGQRTTEMIAAADSGAPPATSSPGSDRVAGTSPGGRPGFGNAGPGNSGSSTRSGFGSGFGSRSGFGNRSSGGPQSAPRGTTPGSAGDSASAPSGTPAAATSATATPATSSSGASQNSYRDVYSKKFREWDVNRNNVLDGDEISPSIRSADRNGDGRITLEELLDRFAR